MSIIRQLLPLDWFLWWSERRQHLPSLPHPLVLRSPPSPVPRLPSANVFVQRLGWPTFLARAPASVQTRSHLLHTHFLCSTCLQWSSVLVFIFLDDVVSPSRTYDDSCTARFVPDTWSPSPISSFRSHCCSASCSSSVSRIDLITDDCTCDDYGICGSSRWLRSVIASTFRLTRVSASGIVCEHVPLRMACYASSFHSNPIIEMQRVAGGCGFG